MTKRRVSVSSVNWFEGSQVSKARPGAPFDFTLRYCRGHKLCHCSPDSPQRVGREMNEVRVSYAGEDCGWGSRPSAHWSEVARSRARSQVVVVARLVRLPEGWQRSRLGDYSNRPPGLSRSLRSRGWE